MKKWTLIFLCSIFHCFLLFGQGQNDNMVCGYDIGMNFSSDIPSLFMSAVNTSGKTSTLSDSNGKVLFYTDGAQVFNKNNEVMPNGHLRLYPYIYSLGFYDTGSIYKTYPRRLYYHSYIIQVDANSKKYYIVTEVDSINISQQSLVKLVDCKIYYCIVDLDLDGGLGDVIMPKNIPVDSDTHVLAIDNGINYGEYWMIVSKKITALESGKYLLIMDLDLLHIFRLKIHIITHLYIKTNYTRMISLITEMEYYME